LEASVFLDLGFFIILLLAVFIPLSQTFLLIAIGVSHIDSNH